MEAVLSLRMINCTFAELNHVLTAVPCKITILRFRHLVNKHGLEPQFLQAVNALLQARGLVDWYHTTLDETVISVRSSMKNQPDAYLRRYHCEHPLCSLETCDDR